MLVTASGSAVLDPLSPFFGRPEFYTIGTKTVHHSRVVRFVGTKTPRNVAALNGYWGDSVLRRMYSSIISAQTVCDVIPGLVQNSNVDVLSIPGLMDMVADCEGEQKFLKRMKAVMLSKSVCNAFIIDAAETFTKSSTSLAGVKELIYDFISLAAGAADIPITRFLSVSPGGMNSTGDSDLRNYYDRLSANQESTLRPALDQIDQVMLRSLLGDFPSEYSFAFPSLWQLSDKEQAEVEEIRSRRDTAYSGLVPESSVLKTIQEEGTYAIDDQLIADLQELESAAPVTLESDNAE
jgi:phage-related protein (TIGR01555 family)